MKIDCTQCEMYRSTHCDDCLVSAVLHPIDAPVEIDDELGSSVGALAGAGLIPVLRFRPRAEPATEPPAAETG
ncbi:MAG TPA: hypothetical protein VM573_05215 [Actinomycetota bacterium]|nr:hypothetical protein [Actinomycetota bacterium]